MGSIVSVFFILSLCCMGHCDGCVVSLNAVYWLVAFFALIADVVIRFTNPDKICTPAIDDPDTCAYIWKQLYIFWGVMAFGLLIWAAVIKRLRRMIGLKGLQSLIDDKDDDEDDNFGDARDPETIN